MENPAGREAAATALEAHERLERVMGEVGGCGSLEQLLPVMDEMYELVEGEFAREEGAGDGLYASIREVAPQHDVSLSEMLDEHRAILAALPVIRDEAVPERAKDFAETKSDVQSVVASLRAHSARECKLLMDTFYRDTGAAD